MVLNCYIHRQMRGTSADVVRSWRGTSLILQNFKKSQWTDQKLQAHAGRGEGAEAGWGDGGEPLHRMAPLGTEATLASAKSANPPHLSKDIGGLDILVFLLIPMLSFHMVRAW